MIKHPPKKLQAVLWSRDVEQLDTEEDKDYIINQILAYGVFEEWRWLFKNYSLKTLASVFLDKPSKTYRPERFNFAKNILLNLEKKDLVKEYYVVNTPRIIKR